MPAGIERHDVTKSRLSSSGSISIFPPKINPTANPTIKKITTYSHKFLRI